jgi:hypothetical protein
MKFWNQVGELEVVDIEVGVVVKKTAEVMDGPFASDVVRNNDVANGHTFQHRCDDIIRVDVSNPCSESLYHGASVRIPFTPLQVANTVLHHERMPRAYARNDTRRNIVFCRLSVHLVDCMKVGATASYLEGRKQRESPWDDLLTSTSLVL